MGPHDSVPSMSATIAQDVSGLRHLVESWARTWGLPGFERKLRISFSPRFRRSLGRCNPATREIRLAAFLLTAPPAVLSEALCHEAAHAAVHALNGTEVRPHGAEWRALMQAAGFEPRVKLPAHLLPDVPPRQRRPGKLWNHRCPVCHASRVARCRVPRWRCAACRAAGLEGALVITPLAGSTRKTR